VEQQQMLAKSAPDWIDADFRSVPDLIKRTQRAAEERTRAHVSTIYTSTKPFNGNWTPTSVVEPEKGDKKANAQEL
ncbi:MAG: hypothetical protein ACHQT8_07535, partial [Chlamydiales bacterium]